MLKPLEAVGIRPNGLGKTTQHARYMTHLATQFPVPPPLRPVDSALASSLQVFVALWSADSQAQGHEPKVGQIAFHNIRVCSTTG